MKTAPLLGLLLVLCVPCCAPTTAWPGPGPLQATPEPRPAPEARATPEPQPPPQAPAPQASLVAVAAHAPAPHAGPWGAGPIGVRTPPTPSGKGLYVAPSGGGSACSQAFPCRQIGDAVKIMRAGDVVFVADGTYDPVVIDGLRGTASAPLTIFAQGFAANVSPRARDSIYVENSMYVVIDGLDASGAGRAGAGVLCSNHVTIRNGRFTGSKRWGVFSGFADDLVIEHVEASGSTREHGIYASNSADRPILRANLVHDNSGAGIQINADGSIEPEADCAWRSAGGVTDGITTGAVVEGNVIYANGKTGAAGINLCGVQRSVVRNNLLYGNHATGIVNYQGDGSAGPQGMEILGNTVVQAPHARQGLQFLDTTGANLVRDNILYHPDPGKAGLELGNATDVKNVDADYDVLDRVDVDDTVIDLAAFRAKYGKEAHGIAAATPAQLFAGVAGNDYAVAAGSAAAGKGVYVANAPVDLAGKARPKAGPDIGALQR